MNCNKATKQRIVLKKIGSVSVLKFLQRLALDFPCNFSRGFLTDTCIENLKKWFQVFQRMKRPQFFSAESLEVKLLFTIHVFLEQPFWRKLFDIRFSYKPCINFSPVCLLVKMVSKTVTRSIIFPPQEISIYMTLDSLWSKCIVQRFS